MFEAEIRALSLFFFLTLLDEERALEAATQATDLFFRKMKSNPQMKKGVAVVLVSKKIWDQMHCNSLRGHPTVSDSSSWRVPQGLDLSPWKEFQKSAPEDEFLALVWASLIKIDENEIAQAMNISEGTLRYRLGRALRLLGPMTGSTLKPVGPVN